MVLTLVAFVCGGLSVGTSMSTAPALTPQTYDFLHYTLLTLRLFFLLLTVFLSSPTYSPVRLPLKLSYAYRV